MRPCCVCCTINIFNVRYLEHVAEWIARQGVDYVYWNMMHDAWYFSIATLPESAKREITQYLQGLTLPASFRREFDRIADFMNRGASTDGFMLRLKIRDLDRKRNQNFASVAPEMAQLIDYDYNTP